VPVVLVHAGVCDNRMWDGAAPLLAEQGIDAVRHELRGFGDTPIPPEGSFSYADDLAAALDEPSVLVGASFGGLVCLELAAARPELVRGLFLLAAALPDHDWSQKAEQFFEEEERLLEAGDVDAATELNVSFWAGQTEPAVQQAMHEMQRRAFELQLGSDAEGQAADQIDLSAVGAPALVVTGERDIDDFQRMAARLAEELPRARRATIAGAAHLPAIERPRETVALLADFLEQLRGV
jgi:3-oxoadipate enol-lactonase